MIIINSAGGITFQLRLRADVLHRSGKIGNHVEWIFKGVVHQNFACLSINAGKIHRCHIKGRHFRLHVLQLRQALLRSSTHAQSRGHIHDQFRSSGFDGVMTFLYSFLPCRICPVILDGMNVDHRCSGLVGQMRRFS